MVQRMHPNSGLKAVVTSDRIGSDMKYISESVIRVDAKEKVTGKAQYPADFKKDRHNKGREFSWRDRDLNGEGCAC